MDIKHVFDSVIVLVYFSFFPNSSERKKICFLDMTDMTYQDKYWNSCSVQYITIMAWVISALPKQSTTNVKLKLSFSYLPVKAVTSDRILTFPNRAH